MRNIRQVSKEKETRQAAITRRNEEEERRQHLTTAARMKFAGSAVCTSLAAAGAAVIAVAHGEVQTAAAISEAISVPGAVSLFGWGQADLHEAADASRNASRLVQVLAEHELIGTGLERRDLEIGPGGRSNGDPAAGSPASAPQESTTSEWTAQER